MRQKESRLERLTGFLPLTRDLSFRRFADTHATSHDTASAQNLSSVLGPRRGQGSGRSNGPSRCVLVVLLLTGSVQPVAAAYEGSLTLSKYRSVETLYPGQAQRRTSIQTATLTIRPGGSTDVTLEQQQTQDDSVLCGINHFASQYGPVTVSGGEITPQFLANGTYVVNFSSGPPSAEAQSTNHWWGPGWETDGDCNGFDYFNNQAGTIDNQFATHQISSTPPRNGTVDDSTLQGEYVFMADAGSNGTSTWNDYSELTWDLVKVQPPLCAGSNSTVLRGLPDCGENFEECDLVTVTVRIDTTNFEADQETVNLELRSEQTGQVLHVVHGFGHTQQFTYRNRGQYDRIVANWVGPNVGDLSCALNVTTNSGSNNPFRYDVKKYATENVKWDNYGLLADAAIAIGCDGSGVCEAIPPAYLLEAALIYHNVTELHHDTEVMNDPPDSNYSEVFVPIIPPPLPGYPVLSGPGVSAEVAQSLNELEPTIGKLASYSLAAQRTIQRLAGAVRAEDGAAQAEQRAALKTYERHRADLIPAYADALLKVAVALKADGVPSFQISPGDIDSAKAQLASTGLGPDENAWLVAVGATQASIDAAIEGATTADSATAAGLFPEILTRQSTIDASLIAAAHLSAPGPFMCYKAKLAPGGTFEADQMVVGDRFGAGTFKTKAPSIVCGIAGFDNVDDQLTAPFDESHHLVGHRVKRSVRVRPVPGIGTTHVISNSFQSGIHLTLRKESHVLVASSATMGDQGTTSQAGALLDDFMCYKVSSPDAPRYLSGDGIIEDIRDQATEQSLIVGKPRYLCIPASFEESEPATRVGAFTCYNAKPCAACAKGRFDARGALQSVANGVTGEAVLRIRRPTELCVPSVLDPPTFRGIE